MNNYCNVLVSDKYYQYALDYFAPFTSSKPCWA